MRRFADLAQARRDGRPLCGPRQSAPSARHARRLCDQFGRRAAARVHVRCAQDRRASVLQIHAPGRSLRCVRADAGANRSLYAAHWYAEGNFVIVIGQN